MIELAILAILVTAYAISITKYHLHVVKRKNKEYDSLSKASAELLLKYMEQDEVIEELENEINYIKNTLNSDSNSKHIFIKADAKNMNPESIADIIGAALRDSIEKRKEEVLSNIDRTKTVLDKVFLWEMTYCIDKKTDKSFYNKEYINKEAIVIEEDCDKIIPHPTTNEPIKLDLCIRYEDDTQLYVQSKAVKLKD